MPRLRSGFGGADCRGNTGRDKFERGECRRGRACVHSGGRSGAAGGGVAAPRKSSNTLLIVLLIIVVIFGGIGAVVVYAAYWVKHKAMSTARDYGVELPSDAHTRGRKSASAASHRDPCSFLTAAEVAAATGVAITEAHTENQTCNFASADGTGAGAFVAFEWGDGKILMTGTRAGREADDHGSRNGTAVDRGSGRRSLFSERHAIGASWGRWIPDHDASGTADEKYGQRPVVLDNIAEMREMEKGLAQKVVARMN